MTQDKSTSQRDRKAELQFIKGAKPSEQENYSKVATQHQPVQQNSTTKVLTELVKRVEGIEKNIEKFKQTPIRQNNRRSGRGRGGYMPTNNQPNQNNRNESNDYLNG